jgi:hypothetical protein
MEHMWSSDNENFDAESLEELIENENLSVGNVVYYVEATTLKPSEWVTPWTLVALLKESIEEKALDYQEGWQLNVSDEALIDLQGFLKYWCDRNINCEMYKFGELKEYAICREDLDF